MKRTNFYFCDVICDDNNYIQGRTWMFCSVCPVCQEIFLASILTAREVNHLANIVPKIGDFQRFPEISKDCLRFSGICPKDFD